MVQSTPTGPSVTYSTGWNLIGAPAGTTVTQASGVLYTYEAGDTAYESLPNTSPVVGGRGYWAYFTAPTTVTLNGTSASSAGIAAPAGQWVMVGNPSTSTSVTVRGADVVYAWNVSTGAYQATTTLSPGQGAWAIILNGGTVTVSP